MLMNSSQAILDIQGSGWC